LAVGKGNHHIIAKSKGSAHLDTNINVDNTLTKLIGVFWRKYIAPVFPILVVGRWEPPAVS